MDLSIIIPTKNRPNILRQTLENAVIAAYDFNVEIIVVNDGNIIENKTENPKINYFNNPKVGVASARNFGASLAKSDLLLFLDDDMWITKDTIIRILKFHDINFFCESSLCLNWVYPKNLVDKYKREKLGRYYIYNNYHTLAGRVRMSIKQTDKLIEIDGIGSASFVISKNIFNKIGKYNEQIRFQGEDIDLYKKLVTNNIQTKLLVDITCFHNDNTISNISEYIERLYLGYLSQAKAEKQGLIKSSFLEGNSIKNKIYQKLLPFEKLIITIFILIPNHKLFDKLTFRIIGIISSLQKTKAYKN